MLNDLPMHWNIKETEKGQNSNETVLMPHVKKKVNFMPDYHVNSQRWKYSTK